MIRRFCFMTTSTEHGDSIFQGRLRVLSVALLACVVAYTSVHAVATEPGQHRTVQFATPSGHIQLDFVYVPSGTAVPFAMEGDVRPQVLSLPYYIMSTEVSVDVFDNYAPADAKASHLSREKEAAGDLLMPDIAQRRANGKEYAVLWVSLAEAAAITAKMNEELRTQQSSATLVKEQVRLATLAEWRHAMSAGSDAGSGFFNKWRSLDELTAKEQGMCRDVWSACGGSGEFQGTPEQVLWLIGNPGSEVARCYDVATLFTRHLITGRETTGLQPWSKTVDPFEKTETLTAAKPNKWGIYGAHRNPCPEWVIGNESQQAALARWHSVESGIVPSGERNQKVFALVGPRFRQITREKLDRFKDLIIWAPPEDASLEDDEKSTTDRKSAFRLVLVESLADDWLRIVRPEILGAKSVEDARVVLDSRTKDVQRLLLTAAERDVALIRAFFAVRAYDLGSPTTAVESLTPLLATLKPSGKVKIDFAARRRGETPAAAETKLSGDGLYLHTLVSLMKQDGGNNEQ